MRVGIITFHCSYNYGSALQSYALQCYINKKKLAQAKVIDYVFEEDFKQYSIFRTYLYKKQIKSFFADCLYLFRTLKRRKNFREFLKHNVPMTEKRYTSSSEMKELNEEFDAFICGSDQIWNVACTNGIVPEYFLDFANDDKLKIAYAPSIAHLDFSEKLTKGLKFYLSKFDYISVREKSTVDVISKLTDKEVKVLIDPTLLLDKQEYKNITKNPKDKEYIFVYMLEENPKLISYVTEKAKELNKKIIYISKKDIKAFKKGKNVFGVSPNTFLGYIANADYVITNSFHATVFSVIFEKKFCTFKTTKSYSRMVDLLTELSLEERIYSEKMNLEDNINYDGVIEKIKKMCENSFEYLKIIEK